MKNTLLTVVLATVLGVGVIAGPRLDLFSVKHQDIELAPSPCVLKGPVSLVVYDSNAWVAYTCADDRVILRRYIHDGDYAPTTTEAPAPPSSTITCPSDPHPACKMLPAGIYERAWADRNFGLTEISSPSR